MFLSSSLDSLLSHATRDVFTGSLARCVQELWLIIVLQPLRWCCVDCVIHHERDMRKEQHHRYMWGEQAIIE